MYMKYVGTDYTIGDRSTRAERLAGCEPEPAARAPEVPEPGDLVAVSEAPVVAAVKTARGDVGDPLCGVAVLPRALGTPVTRPKRSSAKA